MVEKELIGLLLSLLFLMAVVAVGFLAKRSGAFSPETVRKIIHIGVSNWILISAAWLRTPWVVFVGPVLFLILNTVFVYSGAAKILGMGDRKRDNGLIYFPLALIVLYALHFASVITLREVVLGVLVMGYGDGFAAVIGKKFGTHRFSVFHAQKSVEGCLAMFIVSSIVIALVLQPSPARILLLAFVAMLLEAITPFGFDNLTVPILTALLGGSLCC